MLGGWGLAIVSFYELVLWTRYIRLRNRLGVRIVARFIILKICVFIYCVLTLLIFSYLVFERGQSLMLYMLMILLDVLFNAYMHIPPRNDFGILAQRVEEVTCKPKADGGSKTMLL